MNLNNQEVNISAELQLFMQLNAIGSWKELVAVPDEKLIHLTGFTWHLLKEILLLRKVQHFD
uniref:hypothetical protein n=1 Tax=Flavobacterium sp. TaxID=239 RepID=UPI0040494197